MIGQDDLFETSREQMIDSIFQQLDKDGSGTITREELTASALSSKLRIEFEALIKLVLAPVHEIHNYNDLFGAIDEDQSGTISLEELKMFLKIDLREGRASRFQSAPSMLLRRSTQP